MCPASRFVNLSRRAPLVIAIVVLFTFSFFAPMSAQAYSQTQIISSPPAYEWSSFLHDSQHSGYVVEPAPHSNHKIGSSAFRGPEVGSPASYHDVLFMGAGQTFYALNASTFDKIWTHATGGNIESSPAVANGIVYVGSDDGNLYALNVADGSRAWATKPGGEVKSSPALDGGNVFVGSDNITTTSPGNITSYNAATGARNWHYDTQGGVDSSPAVSNGVVVVGSNDHYVYFLNEATGGLIFKYATAGAVESSPSLSGNMAFIGSNDSYVYGINMASQVAWKFKTGGAVVASPVVNGSEVLVGSLDGYLYALNATNGNLIWKTSIGATASSGTIGYAVGNIAGSRQSQSVPGVATIYTASEAGTLYAVTLSDGSIRWTFPIGSTTLASPALIYTKIYVGSSGGTFWQIGELKQSGAVATFTKSGVFLNSFPAGTTIMIGDDEAWGKYGMHNPLYVNITDPQGNFVLYNATMFFLPGKSSQHNFNMTWTIPANAPQGKYKISVMAWDANPKPPNRGRNPGLTAGLLFYKYTFKVT